MCVRCGLAGIYFKQNRCPAHPKNANALRLKFIAFLTGRVASANNMSEDRRKCKHDGLSPVRLHTSINHCEVSFLEICTVYLKEGETGGKYDSIKESVNQTFDIGTSKFLFCTIE